MSYVLWGKRRRMEQEEIKTWGKVNRKNTERKAVDKEERKKGKNYESVM